MQIPPETIDFILRHEGLNQPGEWPGGHSGITIGAGYDLGYCTANDLDTDWGDYLSDDQIARLRRAIGKTGGSAKRLAEEFEDIVIDRNTARAVFQSCSLPRVIFQTERAFPGIDVLPPMAQGALLSLVYNRGTSMRGDHRREMKAIRDIVRDAALQGGCRPEDLQAIAGQIRAMKRLWIGKGLSGLLRRREGEANMVESCLADKR